MTLKTIFKQFKWSISLTTGLVVLEACLFLLFPLFIGYGIDGILADSYSGLFYLGLLGISGLLVGTLRRFYDTRVYSRIFKELSLKTVKNSEKTATSILSARIGMLRELVDFFERSFPQIINSAIGLVGTIIILYSFNFNIFLACLVLLFFTILIFGLSTKKTVHYNTEYNNVIEQQVDTIERRNIVEIDGLMKKVIKWDIKLSDLETINFTLIWIAIISLLIYAIVASVSEPAVKYGAVFSVVMYVFQFSEQSIALPLFYQEWLRLGEISERLSQSKVEE